MLNQDFNCECRTFKTSKKGKVILNDLESIREKCSALNKVYIPDSIWNGFKKFEKAPWDRAVHQSIFSLALQGGYLKKLTFPVHRYLMIEDDVKLELEMQYRKDLIEKWYEKETEVERHNKHREYLGKLSELTFVSFLEEKGWEIINLEALGCDFDIVAISSEIEEYSFEIKYFGQHESEFCNMINNQAWFTDESAATNYLLFKIFDAAKQLEKCSKKRIAICIINPLAMNALESNIRANIIKWDSPNFLTSDYRWRNFIDNKMHEKKYRNIYEEIKNLKKYLNELWISKEGDPFCYRIFREIHFR